MQRKFTITLNGQEVQQDDLNLIATDAALSDDLVLSELFRLTPYAGGSVTKGLLTYGASSSGGGGLVRSNGATNSVRVYPCRALIGSIVTAGTDAVANFQDSRSAVFVGDLTAAYTVKTISSNLTVNNRWDLVYLRVDRDLPEAVVPRYIKAAGPPITETPTSISVVTNTVVSVGVVTGTASAAPVFPALPADGAGAYHIPLAYLVVEAGFTTLSTMESFYIYDQAPILSFSKTTGAVVTRPATTSFKRTGPAMSRTTGGDTGTLGWSIGDGRPPVYIPPSMTGEDVIYIALDLGHASITSNWSQLPVTVIDDSVDWRNRMFSWTVQAKSTSIGFPWSDSGSSALIASNITNPNSSTANLAFGFGQSFVADTGVQAWALHVEDNTLGRAMAVSTALYIYVDLTTGNLMFTCAGTFPTATFFIRLAATAQYPNYL